MEGRGKVLMGRRLNPIAVAKTVEMGSVHLTLCLMRLFLSFVDMATTPKSLTGLTPFLKPYRVAMGFAAVFLLLAAGTTLAFPWVLRQLIDQGLASGRAIFCSCLWWPRLWRCSLRGVITP